MDKRALLAGFGLTIVGAATLLWLLLPVDRIGEPPAREERGYGGAGEPALSEEPESDPETPPQPSTVMVTGIILSGITGEPLPGVRVSLLGAGLNLTTKATETGEWVLACPEAVDGALRFRVQCAGHVAQGFEILRRNVPGNAQTAHPVFLLPVAAHLSGRVVDVKGRPVQGAHVAVSPHVQRWWNSQASDDVKLRTDGRGRFGPVPVPTGYVTVSASSLFHPYLWTTVFVEPGPLREVEVEVVLPPPVYLRGRVVDANGQPLQATVVGWVREVETDDEGRFRIPALVDTKWRLSAKRDGYLSVGNQAAEEGEEVLIELKPARFLAGKLLNADCSPAREGLRINGCGPATVTGPEGTFRLGPAPEGTHEIDVTEGSGAVQGTFEVTLDERGETEGVVLELPEPLYHIEGVVLDGVTQKPLEGVQVGTRLTGPDGMFRVPVGGRSHSPTEGLGFKKEGYRFQDSQPIRWVDSERTMRKILLWPDGRVRVRVLDREGRPVPGAHVMDSSFAMGWTDAQGSVTLRVPDMRLNLTASQMFAGSGRTDTAVRASAMTDGCEIRLRPAATIRVIDERGGVVPDAFLRVGGLYTDVLQKADAHGRIRTAVGSGAVFAPGRETKKLVLDHLQASKGEVETTIVLGPSRPITGVLLDELGRPLPGKRISGGPAGETRTDGLGRFTIRGVARGRTILLQADLAEDVRVRTEAAAGAAGVVLQSPGIRRIHVQLTSVPRTLYYTPYITYRLYESLGYGVTKCVSRGNEDIGPGDTSLTIETPRHGNIFWLRGSTGAWRIYTGLPEGNTSIDYGFPAPGCGAVRVEDEAGEEIVGATIREGITGETLGKTNEFGVWLSRGEKDVPAATVPLVVRAEGFVDRVIPRHDLTHLKVEVVSLKRGGELKGRVVADSWVEVIALLPGDIAGECAVVSRGSFRFRLRHHLPPGRQKLLVLSQQTKPLLVEVEIKEGECTEVVIKIP